MRFVVIGIALFMGSCASNASLGEDLRIARQELANARRTIESMELRHKADNEAVVTELTRQLEAIRNEQRKFEQAYRAKVGQFAMLIEQAKIGLKQSLDQTDRGARKMIADRLAALRTELLLIKADSIPRHPAAPTARTKDGTTLKGVDPLLMDLDRPKRK